MCWGYATGKITSSLLHVAINPYLLLFIAVIPDIDLFLGFFGIRHRTWTHSIIIWCLLFVPFFIKYRKNSIPYFIAAIQHTLIGDFLVGEYNTPFWPISNLKVSLGLGLVSFQNIIIEMIGLVIFVSWMFGSRIERQRFLSRIPSNILSVLPMIPLIGFVLFVFSYEWASNTLVGYGLLRSNHLVDNIPAVVNHPLFPYEMLMHIILLTLLVIPFIQGLRGRRARRMT